MLLLVKDSPQGKKCLPPAEKSAYREEKKLLTTQRKKSLPYGEKTAYRVVVNLPYHPQADYDRIILGFPVWASNFTPPLRTFLSEHLTEIKGKQVAAFACQSGGGADKALAKLRKFMGLNAFEETAVFIDPKNKHTEATDAAINAFCDRLK